MSYIVNAPRQLADGAPHHLRARLRGADGEVAPYRWHFVDHHVCHRASAFLAAPFSRCAVMTLDGRGERATTSYGRDVDSRYESLGEVTLPHSLGLLYEQVTQHLGFLHSSDEYKVMALAAMGSPRHAGRLREHVRVGAHGQFEVEPIDMTALFGPARAPGSPLGARQFELAASLQVVLEETVLELCTWLRSASGERQLAMAGGVALNCVMNVRRATAASSIRSGCNPPQETRAPRSAQRCGSTRASDAAKLAGCHARWRWAGRRRRPTWGRSALLRRGVGRWITRISARAIRTTPSRRSCNGPSGPIGREDFRPVAPALPEEELSNWFRPAAANGGQSPFMLFVYDALPGQRERIRRRVTAMAVPGFRRSAMKPIPGFMRCSRHSASEPAFRCW